MKTTVCLILFLISIESNIVFGLTNKNLHMPENGHWVIEKIPENSGYVSVFYYDNQNNLLHSESIVLSSKNFLTNRLKRKLNKNLKQILLKEGEEEKF